jgi:hypothetical protein
VAFASPPRADIVVGASAVAFSTLTRQLQFPVFVETYVTRLLDRSEFRAVCDELQTPSAIVAALEGKGGPHVRPSDRRLP